MGEEYIGMTLLGPADECENRDETDSRGTHYSREYSWYADDFYEDYYDEFYDFEDAEDYWEAHGGGED